MPEPTRRQWLIESRRAARLTQEKLAQAVGVDTMTVSRWERGVTVDIELRHHEPLAKALSISLDELDRNEATYQASHPAAAEAGPRADTRGSFPAGQAFSPMLPAAARARSFGPRGGSHRSRCS